MLPMYHSGMARVLPFKSKLFRVGEEVTVMIGAELVQLAAHYWSSTARFRGLSLGCMSHLGGIVNTICNLVNSVL